MDTEEALQFLARSCLTPSELPPIAAMLEEANDSDADERFMMLRGSDKGRAYKLKTAPSWLRLSHKASSAPGTSPFVISLIGDTHAGKSTLRDIFLWKQPGYRELCLKKQTLSDPNKTEYNGTTADICLHQISLSLPVTISPKKPESIEDDYSTIFFDTTDASTATSPATDTSTTTTTIQDMDHKIYVLDMEGTDAAGIPSMLQKMFETLKNVSPSARAVIEWILQNPQDRRKAVDFLFPLLAILLSDVVVYISRNTFDTNKFYSKMSQLAQLVSRTDNLTPDLILISNFCTLADVKDSNTITKQFFSQEGRSVHAMGFSSVQCFSVPNYFERGDSVWNEDLQEFLAPCAGAKQFVQVTEAMQNYLKELISERVSLKLRLNLNVSEKGWLALAKIAIRDLPASDSLDSCNNKVFSLWSKYISLATNLPINQQLLRLLLTNLLEKLNQPDKTHLEMSMMWKEWLNLGQHFFAGHQILSGKLSLPTDVATSGMPTPIHGSYMRNYKAMREFYSQHRICAARKMTCSQKEVRCITLSHYHHSGHRNPIPLFEPEDDDFVLVKKFKELAAFFGFGYPSLWSGNFEADSANILYDTAADGEKMNSLLQHYWMMNETSILGELGKLLYETEKKYHLSIPYLWLPDITEPENTKAYYFCNLCFKELGTTKKQFCLKCEITTSIGAEMDHLAH